MLTPTQQQLIDAITSLDVSTVKQLLAAGESPNFMTEDHMPPLHVLTDQVYAWWEDVLDYYDKNIQLDPAVKATKFEPYMQIFDALIDAGANIHLWDAEETYGPLWDVASAAALPMVKKLLALGVDPNTRDEEGNTILSSISDLVFDEDYRDELLKHAYPDEVEVFKALIAGGALTTAQWQQQQAKH